MSELQELKDLRRRIDRLRNEYMRALQDYRNAQRELGVGEISTIDRVREFARAADREFTSREARQILSDEPNTPPISRQAISVLLGRVASEGLLVRVSRGVYRPRGANHD